MIYFQVKSLSTPA
uniref:Uncharacterized protein n=1 Tax=Anguilla anguilla TaxID=7936 RepID=A0A0E9XZK4_ANGAN